MPFKKRKKTRHRKGGFPWQDTLSCVATVVEIALGVILVLQALKVI